MSIICSICGKKQSGLISDFPLSNELMDYRICVSCDDKKRQLSENVGYENIDQFNSIKKFFLNCSCDQIVKVYLANIIDNYQSQIDENIERQQTNELISLKNIEIQNRRYNDFMITTAFVFENYNIVGYKGILNAETVLGTGFLNEFSASFADFFGTTSQKFADKLDEARNAVLENIIDMAYKKDCNAIIALDLDYTIFNGNMIGVIANGTGVQIMKKNDSIMDNLNILEKLSQLKLSNIISDQEYENKKCVILEKIK